MACSGVVYDLTVFIKGLRVKLERGAIYIYEVPLLSEGTLESAGSVSEWKPNPRKTASHHARGLAYADGYLLFGWIEYPALTRFFPLLFWSGALRRKDRHVRE